MTPDFSNLIQKLILSLSLISLLSCYKVDLKDYIHPDKTPKFCSIKKILSFNEYGIDTLVWNFNYNQWGDPASVRLSHVNTGRPEFLFYYDNHRRLTDFVGAYDGNFSFEFWHHYVYEGKKIIRDTIHAFGSIVNGKPVPDPMYHHLILVHHLEYDNYDRIIKNTLEYPFFDIIPTEVEEFTYNISGNMSRYKRTVPEFSYTRYDTTYSNYDSKVNLRRTHKIWMFIDRNYSLNSHEHRQSHTTSTACRLAFRSSISSIRLRFFKRRPAYPDSDIHYQCK